MATENALMGVGFAAQAAHLLGGNPHVLTTTGTAQGTAATVKSKNTELSTAASQTGAIFPADAQVMAPYYIVNPTATTGVVYAPSGQTLGGTLNGSFNLAQNKAAIAWQYKKGYWTYIVLA